MVQGLTGVPGTAGEAASDPARRTLGGHRSVHDLRQGGSDPGDSALLSGRRRTGLFLRWPPPS